MRETDPEINGRGEGSDTVGFARNVGNQHQGHENGQVLHRVEVRPVSAPYIRR